MRYFTNFKMGTAKIILLTSIVLVGIVGCNTKQERWNQFHGNANNVGYTGIKTVSAIRENIFWSQPIGPPGFASPVIGADEIVYISTMDGRVFGFNPDKTLRYFIQLDSKLILSTPTYGQDGMIYLTSLKFIENTSPRKYKSALHILRPGLTLTLLKSFDLPDDEITTAPPKTYRVKEDMFIFVPGYGNLQSSILIFKNLSGLVQNEKIFCPQELTNDGNDAWKYVLGILSGGLSALIPDLNPNKFEIEGIQLREWQLDPTFGFLEDTARQNLIIVAPFNFCGIQGYEWNIKTQELKKIWTATGLEYSSYGSPAIFKVNGETILGDKEGNIYKIHARTGIYRKINVEESILSTPCIVPGGDAFIVGENSLYWISGTSTFENADKIFKLPSSSMASPAVSLNQVYISHSNGILTLDESLTNLTSFETVAGGLSSPAISKTGTIYFATTAGMLLAFKSN